MEHPDRSVGEPSDQDVLASYQAWLKENQNMLAPVGSFQVNAFEDSLQALTKLSYRYKAAFFLKSSKIVAGLPKVGTELSFKNMESLKARLFALNAIRPVMEDLSSERLSQSATPIYFRSLKEANEKNGVGSLVDLGMAPATARVAVQLFEAGLSSSQSFVVDKNEVAQIQSALGQALASPLEHADLKKLSSELNRHQALLQKLSQNPRTHGLGLMMMSLLQAMK
jgi:hypothetical protein